MIYVALLRGINVGGKNKVDMKQLKAVFEDAGMRSVTTYINSGNVVFSSRMRNHANIAARLEEAIEAHFGLAIRVLVRDLEQVRAIVDTIDPAWVDDKMMKCDVMFLWDEVDSRDVLDELPTKPELEEVRYVAGALVWKVDRDAITRSGMLKMVGTPLYKQMTVRNCNTARKLLTLMEDAGAN